MRTPVIAVLLLVSIVAGCGRTATNNGTYATDTVYSTSTAALKSSKIPDFIFSMSKLRHLTITGMDCDYGDDTNCWMIREIPKEIVRLKNLQSLSLNVNSISMLPEEIGELQSLRSLNLSDNPGLQNIDAVTGLENMEELLLFGCGLDSLPADISKLRKLTCLGLTGNNISSAQLSSIKAALPGCRIVFTR